MFPIFKTTSDMRVTTINNPSNYLHLRLTGLPGFGGELHLKQELDDLRRSVKHPESSTALEVHEGKTIWASAVFNALEVSRQEMGSDRDMVEVSKALWDSSDFANGIARRIRILGQPLPNSTLLSPREVLFTFAARFRQRLLPDILEPSPDSLSPCLCQFFSDMFRDLVPPVPCLAAIQGVAALERELALPPLTVSLKRKRGSISNDERDTPRNPTATKQEPSHKSRKIDRVVSPTGVSLLKAITRASATPGIQTVPDVDGFLIKTSGRAMTMIPQPVPSRNLPDYLATASSMAHPYASGSTSLDTSAPAPIKPRTPASAGTAPHFLKANPNRGHLATHQPVKPRGVNSTVDRSIPFGRFLPTATSSTSSASTLVTTSVDGFVSKQANHKIRDPGARPNTSYPFTKVVVNNIPTLDTAVRGVSGWQLDEHTMKRLQLGSDKH